MRNQKKGKLTLRRETIATLGDHQLEKVRGGADFLGTDPSLDNSNGTSRLYLKICSVSGTGSVLADIV